MTTHNIIEQLQNPALTHRHRDLLMSVLKTYQQQQQQQMKGNGKARCIFGQPCPRMQFS